MLHANEIPHVRIRILHRPVWLELSSILGGHTERGTRVLCDVAIGEEFVVSRIAERAAAADDVDAVLVLACMHGISALLSASSIKFPLCLSARENFRYGLESALDLCAVEKRFQEMAIKTSGDGRETFGTTGQRTAPCR